LLKVNELGDSLWIKQYDNLGFSSINNTRDENFIISGRLTEEDGASGNYGLIKIDQNGDTVCTKPYFTDNNTRVKYAFESIDSSIFLAGGYYLPSSNSTGFLVKAKQNGDTIWTRCYHKGEIDDYIIKAVENKDSTITFISNIITESGQSTYIRLTKINSNGDTLWNRNFNDFGCYANDIILAQDSGYLITGYYRDNPDRNQSDDVLLIKTDNDGKVISQTPNYIDIVSNTKKTIIYPNPVNKYLTVDIDIKNAQIYDTNGKILITTRENFIDVSHLSKGIYFMIATDKLDKKYIEKIIIE
jgi:hypothetical protein